MSAHITRSRLVATGAAVLALMVVTGCGRTSQPPAAAPTSSPPSVSQTPTESAPSGTMAPSGTVAPSGTMAPSGTAAAPRSDAISAIGVPAPAAACDAVTTDKAGGDSNHVEPGPRVKYDTVPPSSGPHFAQPAVSDRKFYTVANRPRIEVLVHNLEHGYTVLWYDQQAGQAKSAQLEELATLANKTDAARDKFIVSAWDPSYGALPAGKKFALSHWSATLSANGMSIESQAGHRQLCGDLSGAVVKAFVDKHPRTSAPEPDAQ